MADNFLEKRMDDLRAAPATKPHTRSAASVLEGLLRRNRSHRGYDNSFCVRGDQLERIVAVNCLVPSARNFQQLRFKIVTHKEAHKVLPHIRLGGALPHLHLPQEGMEPRAFIVVCCTAPEPDHYHYIDLGIAAQSMLLEATAIGLNGICIGAFDHQAIKESLGLELEPMLVIAIGKGAEKIELVEAQEGQSLNYYRNTEGTHFVPKWPVEKILL